MNLIPVPVPLTNAAKLIELHISRCRMRGSLFFVGGRRLLESMGADHTAGLHISDWAAIVNAATVVILAVVNICYLKIASDQTKGSHSGA
jgi:hypothetical protein